MNHCEDFTSITHRRYEDAGCYGCSFLMIWTDAYVECQHKKKHKVIRRMVDSRAFGLTEMVIRYD